MSGLRLYDYAASGNCYKVRLLLHQLRLEYERVPVDIFAGETLTEAYRAINSARETPVLQLPDGSHLPESNAILLYLAEGSPFLPASLEERAQVWRWLFVEQALIMPTLAGFRFRILTDRLHDQADIAKRRAACEQTLAFLDCRLSASAFLAGGEYSIADISAFAYIHVAHEAGLDVPRYAAVQSWLDRVAAQPRFMDDLEPYPENARPGLGRSIYD